uniref:Neural proliferation, differentiation and control, 1a n=1 Tax=Haplochromis burtoni TaxID=8153 RepID=A0A3Q2USB6_HAPBU
MLENGNACSFCLTAAPLTIIFAPLSASHIHEHGEWVWRDSCKRGSSDCGPCRSPLQESEEGRCVHKIKAYDLDEEIDFLHSIIERQEVLEMKQQTTRKQSKHPGKKNAAESYRSGSVPLCLPLSLYQFAVIISVCVVVGMVAVILATVSDDAHRFQKESHLAEKVDYPAFGGAGVSMGDKTLAQSAQMFHYQHQKQQMLSMGNHKPEQKVSETEGTSDEEEVGGDFTVYECPGLAPTGEMEVKNPLFDDSAVPYQGNAK